MPDPKLTALLDTLLAIADAAVNGATSPTAEDALDVVVAIESACCVAISEHYGLPELDEGPTQKEIDELRKACSVQLDYTDVPY